MELQNLDCRKGSLESSTSIRSLGRRAETLTNKKQVVHDHSNNDRTVTPIISEVPRKQKIFAQVQFLTLCWTLFLAGWNDGTTGPLIPRIQEVYNIGFAIVSLIFVFGCVGFIVGALANLYLTDKLGFGKLIFLGSLCQVVAYIIQCSAPPFPAFVLAYSINGIGGALQDAQANGFVATLKSNPETKMGILHAAYGLGAFASPFIATQFAQLPRWSFHFLVSLGMAVFNSILLIVVFKLKSQDECLSLGGEVIPEPSAEQDVTTSSFRQVLRTKAVHLIAIFILIYVGVEVTIGGWIVTFIIHERGGGPSSGYISSGFFGGLTVGRVLLLPLNRKIGEWRVLFLYTLLAIGLELTIWFVPSLIGNAVAVSIVGMLLGPMYPIAMNQASRVLPRWILTGSIGWIGGFGQAGSALLPFITGAISSARGIVSLQPLLISMMTIMMALWWFVPAVPRRVE
ncbi:major facilitator superfamily domain-containing protein [Crepidotus variabilis]|uniref:Major facilitator superfamily domain-containing protein n=1 Tax=Crepidotus variabilis TaxID=179855 RepID=A0A9P6EGI0_9AGAR|nr:major facilitator superfamily domain-containing protein [Crepidotus variabilis]